MMETIEAFVEYLALEKNFSTHTVTAYKKDLSQFCGFLEKEFDSIPLVEVNYSIIRSWIVALIENGTSNKTVNRKMSSLKAFYKFLLKIKKINSNPLHGHKSLKIKQKKQLPFSEKEITEVVKLLSDGHFKTYREKAVIYLMYATGMRRAEILSLTIDQIDWAGYQLRITGKGNKERIMPLTENTVQVLKEWKQERAQIVGTEVKAFFVLDNGKPLYPNFVYRLVNHYFSRVSTKMKCSPHIIRHSFATHLLNRGADLNSIKELLGHESLNSTQIYAHYNMNELKQVYGRAHPRNKQN